MLNIILSEPEKEIVRLFRQEWKFVAGATHISNIPVLEAPEIAFIGKSNVGKSSLINLVTGRKALARMSHTPGRTKQINFFTVGENELTLVDLPGYGYAKTSKVEQNNWEKLILSYLNNRPNLKLVCLLIDARRGIKDHDQEVMNLLSKFQVPFFLTFTKTDKINDFEINQLIQQSQEILKPFKKYFIDFLFTSFRRKDDAQGIRINLGTYLRSTSKGIL